MVAGAAETKGQEAQGLEEVLGGATADLLPLGLRARLHHQSTNVPTRRGPWLPSPPHLGTTWPCTGKGQARSHCAPHSWHSSRHACRVGG